MTAHQPSVTDVLGALAAGDWTGAAARARATTAALPESVLARALDDFLHTQRTPGVYDEPTAFEAFIDNGANPELYRRTIEAVRAVHATARLESVVDIGCGDGRVVSAVLAPETTRVDLVEPSRALLAQAAVAVARAGIDVVEHPVGAREMAARVGSDQRWGIAESTFALHATRPDDRPEILRWLAGHAERLVVVEFDVPAFADGSPEHLAYLAERYEAGVHEYVDHPEVIAGFLMPVLVGQLDPDRPRYTFEQPIEAWTAQLTDAGFTATTTPVFDYWWAPAVLIDARVAAAR